MTIELEHARPDTRPGEPPEASVIVAMNDDDGDNDIVFWAARFAGSGGRIIATRCWSARLGELRPDTQRAVTAHLLSELRSWAQPAADLGVPLQLRILDGDPEDAVARLARGEHAQLVVVGSGGRSWTGLASGTLPIRLAYRLHRPLAVVPAGGSAHGLRRVLLAVNGSASSLAACRWVADTAAHHHSDVHVVTVFEPVMEWVPCDDPRSVWQGLRRQLDGPWTEPLTAAGLHHTSEVVEGLSTVEALTAYARHHHLDAIVVGSGDRPRLFHRATTAVHLVQRSSLAVIVVPGPEPAQLD
jgi:nucleotide-binding universal stress UspA family protein